MQELIEEFVEGKGPCEMDGHKFYLPQKGEEQSQSMKEILLNFVQVAVAGVWEPQTTALMKSIVKKGDTAIDVGGSIGYFTLLLARLVGPKGKVITIEPTDHQFRYILKNVAMNGYEDRVRPFMLSAWDEYKIIPMPHAPEKRSIGIRLDDILESIGIREVNIIKSDTDGFELRVLKGLQRTIERSPNLNLIIEYMPKYLEQEGSSAEEMRGILDRHFDYDTGKLLDGYNLHCVRKQ